VLRERVPLGEKVGLSDLDDEEFIVECTAWTIVRRKQTGPTRRGGGGVDVKARRSDKRRRRRRRIRSEQAER
jgi:hypothetical protein